MLNRGPGVYPWSFQGGYGSPEGLRGEIEIPPDPLALAERAENNTRHGNDDNSLSQSARPADQKGLLQSPFFSEIPYEINQKISFKTRLTHKQKTNIISSCLNQVR